MNWSSKMNIRWIIWKEKTGQDKNWEFMAWIAKHVRIYEEKNKTRVGYNQDAFTEYLKTT